MRILEQYPKKLFQFGDQDILNILCRDDPALLEWMPCQFNWRVNSGCSNTPTVLHGNMGAFSRRWKSHGPKYLAAAGQVLKSTEEARRNLPGSLWEMAFPEIFREVIGTEPYPDKGKSYWRLMNAMRDR